MMRITLLFILIFGSIVLKGQDTIDKKYLEAYRYLNECNNLKDLRKGVCRKSAKYIPINVFGKVYPLSILIFDHETIKENLMVEKPDQEVSDFIVQYDKQNDFEAFKKESFSSLFPENKESDVYVIFSKPQGNYMFAEVVCNVHNIHESELSVMKLTEFNKSLAFLFFFDDKGRISKVFTSENQYN